MKMLNDMIKKLAPEFGVLEEELGAMHPINQDVTNRLEKSAKLDEVDTITFGLETDDNKIVKVYVKSDQADDFEKALSDKLGQIDDIEECLNQLSKDFEIIDVEWPEDPAPETGEEEADGSDAMNADVYQNDREKQATELTGLKPKMEHLNFGEKATLALLEDGHSIENRMTTAMQLMIYHAILELGMPELALDKSPYRAAIIKGIKNKALELSRNAAMKNALKTFISRSINFDMVAHKNKEAEQKDHGQLSGNAAKIEAELRKELSTRGKKKPEEEIEESLVIEGKVENYWDTIIKLLTYVSPDDKTLKSLIDSSKFKSLMTASSGSIGKIPSILLRKTSDLVKACEGESMKKSLATATTESINIVDFTALLNDLLILADPSKGNIQTKALMSSAAFNMFINRAKSTLSQKFAGAAASKLSQLQATIKTLDKSPAAITEETSTCEWEFEKDKDDLMVIRCSGLTISLDAEQAEKVQKGVVNHDAIVVKDANDLTHKVVFSPRGINVLVKKVGTAEGFMMTSKDVDEMLSFMSKPDDKEEVVATGEPGTQSSTQTQTG